MGAQQFVNAVCVEKVNKHFGAIAALHDVSFCVREGEIMGLAGHNGAGKSVLVKLMGGIHRPDSGRILYGGKEVRLASPKDAQDRGYFVVPQELNLALQQTVADNVFLGRQEYASKRTGLINRRHINEQTRRLLKENFDLDVDPSQPAGDLDTVTQRIIEVVRCLRSGAKVIVFDETTAGLAQHERARLFEHIRLLAAKGLGIIFISHIIPEMMDICDRVTVLRGGRLVGVEEIGNLDPARLIEMIIGKELNRAKFRKAAPSEDVLFSVRNLSTKNRRLEDISFDLRMGEILGIYGLRDQGQSLLMETLYGAYAKSAGQTVLRGTEVDIRSPKEAIRNGITFLPERGLKTVFAGKTIVENLVVASSNHVSKGAFVFREREREQAAEVATRYGVRGFSSLDRNLTSLSGGNMQKVMIARTLALDPSVTFLIEPTQGIDIGAKEEVKELILEAAREGKGIIIVTAEIDDVIEICNRVIIVKDGKVRAVLDADGETKSLIVEESAK
jgi:ABC-type sugar transport system ATPase subunit